ncbi:hypothetical protein ACJ72_07024 [Emergomyces africanus]|uniref:Uncharacterized protein n=1 Tax=Emergomyces africanus TaxID=1955775 RepID=A0A1B7NPG4_9EURO|nr:hypothetical protein ACJ72_07024 [Emergomyces africanus]
MVEATCDPSDQNPKLTCTLKGSYPGSSLETQESVTFFINFRVVMGLSTTRLGAQSVMISAPNFYLSDNLRIVELAPKPNLHSLPKQASAKYADPYKFLKVVEGEQNKVVGKILDCLTQPSSPYLRSELKQRFLVSTGK